MLAEDVYRVLTNKRFRSTALPSIAAKELIIGKIAQHVSKNEPVQLFQFWGGCKNVNLEEDLADLTEIATLDNLFTLNSAVQEIYEPGLKIFISPGDARVENVNHISREKTKKYVDSLRELVEDDRYNSLFCLVPISELYGKYSRDFDKQVELVRSRISSVLEEEPRLEKLVANARKNIVIGNTTSTGDLTNECVKAAKEYVVYRVAEEEAEIFRDYSGCIRSFFIKYTPFYRKYISDISKTSPNLDCSLVFYTGRKGNVTQPWQSVGVVLDNRIHFMSQERLLVTS